MLLDIIRIYGLVSQKLYSLLVKEVRIEPFGRSNLGPEINLVIYFGLVGQRSIIGTSDLAVVRKYSVL